MQGAILPSANFLHTVCARVEWNSQSTLQSAPALPLMLRGPPGCTLSIHSRGMRYTAPFAVSHTLASAGWLESAASAARRRTSHAENMPRAGSRIKGAWRKVWGEAADCGLAPAAAVAPLEEAAAVALEEAAAVAPLGEAALPLLLEAAGARACQRARQAAHAGGGGGFSALIVHPWRGLFSASC